MLGNRLSQQLLVRAKAATSAKKSQTELPAAFTPFAFFARLNLFLLLTLASQLHAQDTPKFLGPQSCSTSGCHGGADDKSRQYTVWSKYDVHHERPYATLTTARTERISETLKIADATQSGRCTVCHAPMQTVPAERRDPAIKISDGVSCENCHGPAENWIRSHTRKDYTHADRVHAGMRDLQNLYVRANTCVACHQNVDADILAAGHPELTFELDGQCVTEPKHWQETTNWNGAQAWLVGQAVALREMNWAQSKVTPSPATVSVYERQLLRWAGLGSVLTQVANTLEFPASNDAGGSGHLQSWADQVARKAADIRWTPELTRKCLAKLADSENSFIDAKSDKIAKAYTAQYRVLALDRVVSTLPTLDKNEPVQSALKQLFKDAQSLPDFNPSQFADHLAEFQKALPAM